MRHKARKVNKCQQPFLLWFFTQSSLSTQRFSFLSFRSKLKLCVLRELCVQCSDVLFF
jgi:hypothetical protein